jgi:arginine decarboxylase-like protein
MESLHDAQQIKEQAQSMFDLGLIELESKAKIETDLLANRKADRGVLRRDEVHPRGGEAAGSFARRSIRL